MERLRPPLDKPRALVLDADRTVVEDDFDNIPKIEVFNAIVHAQRIIPVSICTGRQKEDVEGLFEGFGINSPISIDYGSKIISPTGETLWEQSMVPDDAAHIQERLVKLGLSPAIVYHSFVEDEVKEKSPYSNVFRIVVAHLPFTMRSVIRDLKNEFPQVGLAHRYRDDDIYFAFCGYRDKGIGLIELAKVLNVPPGDIITAGDDEPDIPMFKASGWAAAVDNAWDEVKDEADHIIPSVEDNGVAHLIKEFVLNRQ